MNKHSLFEHMETAIACLLLESPRAACMDFLSWMTWELVQEYSIWDVFWAFTK